MANNISLIVYPVKDIEKSKKCFNQFLGTEPYMENERYVGYKVGDREVGLDPNSTEVVSYIDVEDIEVSLQLMRNVGAKVVKDMWNIGGGLYIAQVKVEDTILGLRQLPQK